MSERRWPQVGCVFISPDRSKAWYIAGRTATSDLLWGVCVSAKTFETGTVAIDALAEWEHLRLDRMPITRLAVTWLARRWALPSALTKRPQRNGHGAC